MSSEVEMDVIPVCDFCGMEDDVVVPEMAVVDAKTRMGGWAYMCTAHWGEYTEGRLGTGHGQRLILRGKS